MGGGAHQGGGERDRNDKEGAIQRRRERTGDRANRDRGDGYAGVRLRLARDAKKARLRFFFSSSESSLDGAGGAPQEIFFFPSAFELPFFFERFSSTFGLAFFERFFGTGFSISAISAPRPSLLRLQPSAVKYAR